MTEQAAPGRRSDRSLLRIVVWNCAGGMAKKLEALAELEPDLAIVPEGSNPLLLRSSAAGPRPNSSLWMGRAPRKGLTVMAFRDWSVRLAVPLEPLLEWVLPAAVDGPEGSFSLLAVWSMNRRAKDRYPVEPNRLQVQQSVHRYEELFGGDVVVAGDFNNHIRWDKPGKSSNHAATAELLRNKGLVSAYHHDRKVAFGHEPEPTIYWRNRAVDGPTYHIDYCFLPERWLPQTSVSVGSFEDWVAAKRSDHVPLVVDIDLSGVVGPHHD